MNEEDKKYAKTNSGAADNHNSNMDDYIPEEIMKIYPYRAINGTHNKAFTGPMTATIVTMSQNQVDDFNELEEDKDGNKFLRMLTSSSFSTKLEAAPGDVTLNKKLRNLRDFSGITDQHFEEHEDPGKIDFVTFGEPFNKDKYKEGLQQVFSIAARKLGKESDIKNDLDYEGYVYDEDVHYSEMEFVHVESWISGNQDASIHFLLEEQPNLQPKWLGEHGIGLEVENGTLMHKVRAKGLISKDGAPEFYGDIDFNIQGGAVPTRMSVVDTDDKLEMQGDWFNSRMILPNYLLDQYSSGTSLANVRTSNDVATPGVKKKRTSTVAINADSNGVITFKLDDTQTSGDALSAGEKIFNIQILNSYAWLGVHLLFVSYDSGTRELVCKSNFGSAPVGHNFKAGGIAVEWIPEADMKNALFSKDLELIEDMLIISAGFADAWAQAPVLVSGGDAGKIDPTYRVGHAGMKISSIVGHSPYDIIDGMIETHIRKYPDFWASEIRKNMFFSHVAALSRYIYSSYAIAKGGSNFNEIYLPWYLEVSENGGSIEYNSTSANVVNRDSGADKTLVKSSVLAGVTYSSSGSLATNSTIKFTPKSHYFKTDFSNQLKLVPTSNLSVPVGLDISNSILVETDRKFLLPTLNASIQKKAKINFPGDISKADDLEFLYFLPNTNWKKLYVDSVFDTEIVKAGSIIEVPVRRTPIGITWRVDDLIKHLKTIYPGSILQTGYSISPGIESKEAKVVVEPHGISRTETLEKTFFVFDNNDKLYISSQRVRHIDGDYSYTKINSAPLTKGEAALKIEKHFGYEHGSVTITELNPTIVKYDVKYSFFTKVKIQLTKDLNKSYSYASRPFKFDSQTWRDFIGSYGINPNDTTIHALLQKNDFAINRLERIDLHLIWGNKVKIVTDSYSPIEIELPSQNDESITKQTIIFY